MATKTGVALGLGGVVAVCTFACSAADGGPVPEPTGAPAELASTSGDPTSPPCDPTNPSTWRFIQNSESSAAEVMSSNLAGIVVDGESVDFGTCLYQNDNVCNWEHAMLVQAHGDRYGVVGWPVSNGCEVYTSWAYDLMFFSTNGSTSSTWSINDQWASVYPVYAISIRPTQFTFYGSTLHWGPNIYVSSSAHVTPAYSSDLTSRAGWGVAAGDPTNHPL